MSDMPLCVKAYNGNFTEVVDIIKKDSDSLTRKDSAGRTVLHWSACGGHVELVKFLITTGLTVDDSDESGWTPLMIAASAGREDVFDFLLKYCAANPNAVNSTGQRPLHYVASKNRLGMARDLLFAGADANVLDWGGNTPLHRAVSKGHTEMVKLLLSGNLDPCDSEKSPKSISLSSPNIPNKAGQTPVHYACEEGNISALRLLLLHGGDLNLRDKDEKTPIDLSPDHLRVAMPVELGLSRPS